MTRKSVGVCASLLVCGAATSFGIRWVTTPREVPAQSRLALASSATGLPLSFERNLGQADPSVRYTVRGPGYQLILTDDGAAWAVERPREHAGPEGVRNDDPPEVHVIRMRLAGSTTPSLTGIGERPGRVHYLRGSDPAVWHKGVPMYARVHYDDIYPGIDLEYYGRDGELEYDFVVAPGADPSVISLTFDGAGRIATDPAGDLVLETPAGRLVQRKPVAYQEVAGGRTPVGSRYALAADGRVTFELDAYDRAVPLVIDPVMSFSTYAGGTGGAYGDQAYGVAADLSDNVYLTGKTASATFPVGGQPASNDVFVMKLTAAGEIGYVTVLSGNGSDSGEGIAVDAGGQAIVTGFTDSTNFPLLNPVRSDGTGRDIFALKLDAAGLPVYSTYLGGNNGFDYGETVAVDAAGNAFIAGSTKSSDLPVLNAFQPAVRGQDGFIVKLDPAGSLLYGTYLGGSSTDVIESIAVEPDGGFTVTGWTISSDFPRAQSTVPKQSGEDVIVTRFLPDGSGLVYSRYLGGGSHERAFAITPDGEGGVYVGGRTDSTNFPASLAIQGDQPGTDAFVTRLGPAGVVAFSTYLGGSDWERVLGLSVRDGFLHGTGQTYSADFPVLDGVQPVKAGAATNADGFVFKLDVALSTLVYSTFLGGGAMDEGRSVAPLAGSNVAVVGWTESSDFPTVRALQSVKSNVGNAFVSRLAPVGVERVSPGFIQAAGGESVTITGDGFIAGAAVSIGGVPATDVVVQSGQTLTATAPAIPVTGSVDVTVTNTDGGSGTLYRGVVVLNGTGPIAEAGRDQTVQATLTGADVTLDGTASYDPDNEPLTYEWRDAGGALLGTGALTTAALPIGDHTITLSVSDGHSTPGTDTVLVRVVDTVAPSITVIGPNAAEKLYTGSPAFIEWTASDNASGLSSFDVYLSTDGGLTWNPTPICAAVPGSATSCTWTAPAPVTSKARVRVTARDASGNAASDASNANVTIASGTAFVRLTSPNTSLNWGAGSTQQIKWSHNLGTAGRIRLEASVDGGATWALIEGAARNTSSSSSVYNWTLPATLTAMARVRATWTGGFASDVNDTNFTIASPYVSFNGSPAGANWGYATRRSQSWTTNLGPGDRLHVVISTDGGATFPVTVATSQVATSKKATFTAPVLGSPTTAAQLRILWGNAPTGMSAQVTHTGTFRIEPAFLTVTSPDGGNLWTVGSSRSITWAQNLGSLESVRVELSQDDGATYPIIALASTPSDGSQSVIVPSSWITDVGRVRITWNGNPALLDASNASFMIR